MHKVVFHVDEDSKLTMGINNIKNILKTELEVSIAFLLNGEAPKAAIDDERLSELIELNVEVLVCKNSLNGLKIEESELLEGITVVPTGVLELVYRQEAGYAYIRP